MFGLAAGPPAVVGHTLGSITASKIDQASCEIGGGDELSEGREVKDLIPLGWILF